jgi:hypothetical protein
MPAEAGAADRTEQERTIGKSETIKTVVFLYYICSRLSSAIVAANMALEGSLVFIPRRREAGGKK